MIMRKAMRNDETEPSSNEKGRQGSNLTRRSEDTSGPLPALLNRPENMAKKKEKFIDSSSIDEAHLILSKHRDLGYIPFLTAGSQIQKAAQAQFAGAKEDYQLIHPVGLVLTYATLSKYYPAATSSKVLQLWKQALEDWQALGDRTRNLYSLHEYKEWERLYGRHEKTFDKEKSRKSLMESYLQREQNMRVSARRTGKNLDAFEATAFENITFQEAARNDILLNTVFLANPTSLINEDTEKRMQFEREKNVKYIDFPAKTKQGKSLQDEEPDAMDLYLDHLEAEIAKDPHRERRKIRENDPKKAFAHTGAMMVTRALQQGAKGAARYLRPV